MNKRIVVFSIFLSIISIVIFYLLIFSPMILNGRNIVYEDKLLKYIHMKHYKENLDIVFIGNSRTVNQISTNRFKSNGINIYNYGRSAMYLLDLPTPVELALKLHPKVISMQIKIPDLYKMPYKPELKFPTYIDRKFYDEHPYHSLNDFISENIRLKDITRTTTEYFSHDIDNYKKVIQQKFNYKILSNIDCDIVGFRGEINERTEGVCSNGDGIIFNSFKKRQLFRDRPKRVFTYSDNMIDDNKINILNKLIEKIKSQGVTPVIIFEPKGFNTIHRFNLHKIKSLVHIHNRNIINLSNFNTDNFILWADIAHFNALGRKEYTDKLISFFSELKK